MSIQELQTSRLDINNNYEIDLTLKQLDDIIFKIIVYDKSLPADLSNYTARLKAFKSDQVPLIQNTQIYINNNEVTIIGDPQLGTTSGIVKSELQFINKTTFEKKSTFYININVVASVLETDRGISVATCTLLKEIENALDKLENIGDILVEATEVNTELKDTTIPAANVAKINLESGIDDANTSKVALDQSKTNADNSKSALDESIEEANNSKSAIDLSKTNADNSKAALDESIEEANNFVNNHGDIINLDNRVTELAAQTSDVANKLNSQYINVKYPPAPLVGAKGDGLTDDSTVIQNIVNSVTGDGTTIYFPKGDYLFNNVSVLKSGIRIVGTGNGTVFINNHTTNYCLTFGDGTNDYNHMGIEGIRFGQQTGITSTAGGALRFYKTNKSFIRDIKVLNFPSAVFRGVYIYQCVGIFIDSMEIEKCLEDGFRCKNHTDLTISNSRSDSNTLSGFTIDSVSGLYATNVTAYGNKQAFSLIRTDSKVNQFHFYSNCIGDTSQDYNWNIKYLKDSTFTNCWGSGQRSDIFQTYGAGFYVDSATDCVNVEFHACCAQYNNAHGFDIRSGDRIKIIGGYAKKNGQNASGHGVRIGTITNMNVEGFTAFDDQTIKTQQAGINITGTADYVIVKNCNLRGNVLSNGLKDDSGAINKIISDNFTA